jgi:hypothetical protein
MPRMRPLVALVAAVAAGGLVPSPARAAPTAPVAEGVSPDGERYRLMPGREQPGDDVRGSWCLKLQRTGQVITDRDEGPFALALATCGPRPAPAVSGAIVLDCEQKLLFAFGGAKRDIGTIRVVRHRRPPVVATRHRLPAGSGFRGSTFVVVTPLDTDVVRIRAVGVPRSRHPRITGLRAACRPLPGGSLPSGPFATFDTNKRRR